MDKKSQKLIDIELIKTLKAKYFRTLDMKDWNGFLECFTEDLETDLSQTGGKLETGRDKFVNNMREILRDAVTIHHGNMPEIQVLDAENANGIWAMQEIVMLPELSVESWGHCHEVYRKLEGVWKIASIRITRLRVLHNGEEAGHIFS